MFDATNANPNGDPDGKGQARADLETGHGLVTDVALKRRIRDTVALLRGDHPEYQIFVEAGHALQPRVTEGWDRAEPLRTPRKNAAAASKRRTREDDEQRLDLERDAVAWLCRRYFDVRMFGAVLTRGRGEQAVGVRGPVQLTMAHSLDPVLPTEHTITRVTQTRQADIDKGERTEIGDKKVVPYGLYRAHLYYSAAMAAKTGVTSEDLDALWWAIVGMYEHTRSANSAGVDIAGVWVWSHPDAYGVAPARTLLDRVQVTAVDRCMPPRAYTDYQCRVVESGMPAGVELTTIVNIWEQS